MTEKKSKKPDNPILIVDDEIHALKSFEVALRSIGLNNIIPCPDSLKVYEVLEKGEIEVVLLDIMMPGLSGEENLARIVEHFPEVPVIMVTGVNDVETAVRCMQKGAFDYILKPLNGERLLPVIYRAIEVRQLRRENAELTKRFFSDSLDRPETFSKIITQSPKMGTIFRYCEAVAKGNHPILITGETGVGKELIAEAIHEASGRKGNLVAVNAAGLDDNMFSDTLFGHVRGAFTDAAIVRSGQIELAAAGTMFLDEIGDLTPISQVKLLRLLDKHEYFPLGSDVAKPASARFIFATHRDLSILVKEGHFREDLYYRLRTHHLHIPPLRERLDDIPVLLSFFINEASIEFGKKPPSYPQKLLSLLQTYGFPGNVRELKSMVFDVVGTCTSNMLFMEPFRASMQGGHMTQASGSQPSPASIRVLLAQLERFPTLKETVTGLIEQAMAKANNNQRVAALMLGITPQALNQRLKNRV